MSQQDIKRAGENALRLATQMADLVTSSEIPAGHWDEVLERVGEILSAHAAAANEGAPEAPVLVIASSQD